MSKVGINKSGLIDFEAFLNMLVEMQIERENESDRTQQKSKNKESIEKE